MKREIVLSFDDGARRDLRLAELLKKYGMSLATIFYISNATTELTGDEIRKLSKDFQIGGHTVSHPDDMKKLSSEYAYDDIYSNKVWLEQIIGREITEFCYPSGRYDDRIIEEVKRAGFEEARTTLVLHTEFPEDKFKTHPTIHIYPNRKEYKGQKWSELALEQFGKVMQEGGRFEMWGHSEEITRFKLWEELESVFKIMHSFLGD